MDACEKVAGSWTIVCLLAPPPSSVSFSERHDAQDARRGGRTPPASRSSDPSLVLSHPAMRRHKKPSSYHSIHPSASYSVAVVPQGRLKAQGSAFCASAPSASSWLIKVSFVPCGACFFPLGQAPEITGPFYLAAGRLRRFGMRRRARARFPTTCVSSCPLPGTIQQLPVPLNIWLSGI